MSRGPVSPRPGSSDLLAPLERPRARLCGEPPQRSRATLPSIPGEFPLGAQPRSSVRKTRRHNKHEFKALDIGHREQARTGLDTIKKRVDIHSLTRKINPRLDRALRGYGR